MADGEGISEFSAEELVAKEEWAVSIATYIANTVETKVGHIEYDTALKAARFASMWLDEFKAINEAGGEDAGGDPRAVIKLSRQRALEKTQALDRYPNGVPTLKTIIASWHAFTLAFDRDEQPEVWRLLTQSQDT